MNDILRTAVWQDRLTADFNARYWDCEARCYLGLETWSKIILAVITSGGIAGWYVFKSHPTVWFYINSGASLASNLVIPRLKWTALITKLQAEKRAWEKIHGEYEKLWRDVEMDAPEQEVKKRLDALTDRCAHQAGKTTLPKYKFLQNWIQKAVIKANTPLVQEPKSMEIKEIDPDL